MYDARAVANHLLGLAEKTKKQLTPMQLVKLVYISHGWHLALLDRPLINEEVEAWRYGPVVPSVYHAFKEFGAGSVTKKAIRYNENKPFELDPVNADTLELLDSVWDIYSDLTGVKLSAMTHQQKTPWFTVTKDYHGSSRIPMGLDIPNETIKAHYKALLDEANKVDA